ncbi:MAG TPA: hypothetical protein ENK26_02185 [Gammaproteobacteria bacterium]|nr:hypothetical protein [Gammaproteobacteria bacterium]
MEKPLAIVIDGRKIYEYDRSTRLPGLQRRYLDELDERMMREGVPFGDELIPNPNAMQRAQYIANTLINALFDNNEQLIAATSAYLGTRVEDLKQVKAASSDRGMVIELVFDRYFEDAAREQPIHFTPLKKDA